MGDRANVHVAGTFLYTHWGGTELPETVRAALIRGESRWMDDAYLARIIFCDMIAGSERELTGYGISVTTPDGEDRVLQIDTDKQAVGYTSWDHAVGDLAEPAVHRVRQAASDVAGVVMSVFLRPKVENGWLVATVHDEDRSRLTARVWAGAIVAMLDNDTTFVDPTGKGQTEVWPTVELRLDGAGRLLIYGTLDDVTKALAGEVR